jgi:hypothetical protein
MNYSSEQGVMGLKTTGLPMMFLASLLTALAAAPEGWFMAGSKPASYDTGVDSEAMYNGHPSAFVKSKQPSIDGFGTLMQQFKADQYLGKRIRFSAFVKSEGVKDWAGLWMRVDKGSGASTKTLAFDNMQHRAIKGTTNWQNYEVVLDVPEDATGIFFGILLSSTGSVWLNTANFDVVPISIPTTGTSQTLPEAPKNLDFQR